MARVSGPMLLHLLLCACAARAESDEEMLQLGECALCMASHSKLAHVAVGSALPGNPKGPTSVNAANFNAFLVFGIRPCSGVIVSKRHIITNAYCTEHATNGTAFMGGTKYQSLEDLKLPEVKVSLVTDIRYFNPVSEADKFLDHDVAIVKMAQKVEFSDCMMPAELSTDIRWAEPEVVTIFGFGESFQGDYSHELKSGEQMVEIGWKCSDEVITYRLGNNSLCSKNTTFSMCWGDMGGAVVNFAGKLVGLIAYKTFKQPTINHCSQPALTTFYMLIGYYSNWIHDVISSDER